MIRVTVADLLDDNLNVDTQGHRIYVVRDGDTVFYVGRSRNVVDRLLGHLGKGTWGWAQYPSHLGELVKANMPESLDWQVDLMTPGDCGVTGTMIKGMSRAEYEEGAERFPLLALFPWNETWEQDNIDFDDSDIDQAERLLIAKYKPCLNVIYNAEATPLPQKYDRYDRRGERAKIAAAAKMNVAYRGVR